MELRTAGDRGLLAVFDVAITARELHASSVAARGVEDVLAAITGHSSLLTIWRGRPDGEALRAALEASRGAHIGTNAKTHAIRVSFCDAPDLEEFLSRVNLPIDEFLRRVSGVKLTARYLGFRAGFAYLDGWPDEWAMPRRPSSRPRVAAGTFGIAGATAGFYPIDSPGGWNLLGLTNADLWDEERNPPNLIAAGDQIEIVPTTEALVPRRGSLRAQPLTVPRAAVIAAPLAQVVAAADWSRLDCGAAAGGPFDLDAAMAANRATGNSDDAPILECAAVGPRLRLTEASIVSWYGAAAEVRVDGNEARDVRRFRVERGQELVVGRLHEGLRGYLAIGATEGEVTALGRDDRLVVRVIAGPHESSLRNVECEVTRELNRVGIRLRPLTPIAASIPADMKSVGMQFGTIQLHPDGTLIAMGPDHPVTGGYLQPMTVISTELWKLGQLMPGETVRFVEA